MSRPLSVSLMCPFSFPFFFFFFFLHIFPVSLFFFLYLHIFLVSSFFFFFVLSHVSPIFFFWFLPFLFQHVSLFVVQKHCVGSGDGRTARRHRRRSGFCAFEEDEGGESSEQVPDVVQEWAVWFAPLSRMSYHWRWLSEVRSIVPRIETFPFFVLSCFKHTNTRYFS